MKAKESRPPGSLQRMVRPLTVRIPSPSEMRAAWDDYLRHRDTGQTAPASPPETLASLPAKAGHQAAPIALGQGLKSERPDAAGSQGYARPIWQRRAAQQLAAWLRSVLRRLDAWCGVVERPNDPSSATASLGCLIANRSATEPFAAAHG